jgi:ATP-dependent Lhr-like helicase
LLVADRQTLDVEAFARRLLARYGVVFRDLIVRERIAPPWRELLGILRRLEAQGEIRGGRFVGGGLVGEQFALPDALEGLRAARRSAATPDERVAFPSIDPLYLAGTILPRDPHVAAPSPIFDAV